MKLIFLSKFFLQSWDIINTPFIFLNFSIFKQFLPHWLIYKNIVLRFLKKKDKKKQYILTKKFSRSSTTSVLTHIHTISIFKT